ncbi:hypothetical protein F4824DRAFT_488260 [Ustulina deusta]|nr:hypothetical protein F4824DRAFT_488260 [Ustulina deusta]
MPSSLEAMESSPSGESISQLPSNSEQELKVREWSQFELDTVCALICKYEHYGTSKKKAKRRSRTRDTDGEHQENYARDWALRFATKLNEALHGMRNYKHDIPVADVRELMDFIETKNKTVMAYIKRQSIPFRVTRSKKYAFQRLCNNFNNNFYKWTLVRREQRRNPNVDTEEEQISRLSWVDYYVSSRNKENHLLGAARIQRNAQLLAKTESGWISNSAYARRSREVTGINTTSGSGQDLNAHSPRQSMLPAKPGRRFRHQNPRRIMSRPPPPPPPPPPSSGLPAQYKQVGIQPFKKYDMASYGGMEAETHTRPTRRACHDYLDLTPPSPTPLPPTSPSYLGHADLRQTIHPTGPRPETPLPTYQDHSGLQQSIHMMGQQPGTLGSLTSLAHASPYGTPIHKGYQHPEPRQEKGNFDHRRVAEAPASPLSPMYTSGTMSTGMARANAEAQAPIEPLYEDGYGNELYPTGGGYSEYSVNYHF